MTQTKDDVSQLVDSMFPAPAPKIKAAFHNSLGSCKYIFKNGTEAPFTGGHYYTDKPDEIAELNAEVAAGHPHIFVKPEQLEVNTALCDPLDEVRRQAAEEALRRVTAIQKTNDMGKTEFSGKLEGIGNSATVGDAMSGSNSADTGGGIPDASAGGAQTATAESGMAARLAALKGNG